MKPKEIVQLEKNHPRPHHYSVQEKAINGRGTIHPSKKVQLEKSRKTIYIFREKKIAFQQNIQFTKQNV